MNPRKRPRARVDPIAALVIDRALPGSETLVSPLRRWRRMRSLLRLGPGLITGAADDDPSGIGTYSLAGAQFGMGMLWTTLFSLPLMAAIQEIAARLGRITGAGIAANLRKHYARPILYALVLLLCAANVFNLGADITAMSAAAHLLVGGDLRYYALGFGLFSLALQVIVPYRRYVPYLKWLTLVLFAYVATGFVVHIPWLKAARATVIPSMSWNSDYLMGLIAVLGTTISPYLFFWQASQEAEDVRVTPGESALNRRPSQARSQFRRINLDTRLGMALSNVIAFFIMLTSAVTIPAAAAHRISTAADAARALQPVAGHFAALLFAIGIVGTGLLAIPVLAGSAGYAVAETFAWRASLERTAAQAPQFYIAIGAATLLGLALSYIGMNPIRALYWAAILNGIVAGPLMAMLMVMSSSRAILGHLVLPARLRAVGWIATVVMLAATAAFLAMSLLRRG